MSPDFDEEFASPADYARYYRSIGMQVVPAYTHRETKNWKRPHLENWKHFTTLLSTQEQFDEWYGTAGRYSQRSNMGLITGVHPRRVIVVDLDTHKNPRAQIWWDGIHAEHNAGILSECPTQRTGGGGYQMLFIAPEGWSCPTCKNSELGVDIRGVGGFAMLPPSQHESGKSYGWVEDKEPWTIEIEEMPKWMCNEIDLLGTSSVDATTGERVKTPAPEYIFNEWGKKLDGREDRMKSLVFKYVINLYRDCPFIEKNEEAAAKVACYQEYIDEVESRLKIEGMSKEDLLEKEGRGKTLFEQKWRATMRQWDTKISEEAKKPPPEPHQYNIEKSKVNIDDYKSIDDIKIVSEKIEVARDQTSENQSPNVYKLYTMDDMEAMPPAVELVEDIIAEDTFGFIYGAPGCGKTFIAMSLGLSIAYKLQSWFWGKKLNKGGPVIYISNEGFNVMWKRMKAWKIENGIAQNDKNFVMLADTVNLTKKENVDKLMATIKLFIQDMGQMPVAIIIDTVSRSIAGSDENAAKEMSIFVEVCDTIKRLFKTNIIGVHHTGRAGTNMRGSTALDGAADYLLFVKRDKTDGNLFGTIEATKIKAFEDGWIKNFELKKKTLTIDGKGSLVAVGVDSDTRPKDGPRGVSTPFGGVQETGKEPDLETCRRMVAAINDAWVGGYPWSHNVKSREVARYAPDKLSDSFGLSVEVCAKYVNLWIKTDVIVVDMWGEKRDKRGLKRGKGL